MPFELRITDAGREALADGSNRGTNAVRLTKMAIGSGQGPGGAADDGRTALRNQRAVVALGGSTMVSGRIAVRGEFQPTAAYGVTELGLLGQVGADPEILVAYWTDDGERLASTVADTRLVIAGSIDIAPAAAEVTVNVDASVSLGDPALSATITALGGRVDTAETDIDAVETRMTAAESDIDALVDAGFAALITALATRVAALESGGTSVIRSIQRGSVTGPNNATEYLALAEDGDERYVAAAISSVDTSKAIVDIVSVPHGTGGNRGFNLFRAELASATQVRILGNKGTSGANDTWGNWPAWDGLSGDPLLKLHYRVIEFV